MIIVSLFRSSREGTRDTARDDAGVASREAVRLRLIAAILLVILEVVPGYLYSSLQTNDLYIRLKVSCYYEFAS